MNQVKCYKLVLRTADDTLLSLFAPALPPGWPVEYFVGQPVYPHTGELFAFDTEKSARTYRRTINSLRTELYEALAEAPVRPIDSVCPLCTRRERLFHDFWDPDLTPDWTEPAPPGTITTRSLTLIKRLL